MYKEVLKGEPVEGADDAAVQRVQRAFRLTPYYHHKQELIGPAGTMKVVTGEIMAKLS